MIVDSSALVALLRGEPDADVYRTALRTASSISMSAANYLESGIVVDRDARIGHELDAVLERYRVAIVPVTLELARIARQAYLDFGKGTGHRAQLNFGDCFAYALAVDAGEPLLYKGDDFAHTGIRSALAGT